KRFGGNKETKKVQKTLLKQQYENFTGSSSKSLPTEWRTHTLIWRNKADLEEQSLDDLFNSLKIYETEVTYTLLQSALSCGSYITPPLTYQTPLSSESDVSMPASPKCDRYQSGEGYHAVPPPYTGTFMPPKPDLVFHDAPNVSETVHTAFHVELNPTKPDKYLSHTYRPSAPIIEDWVSDSEDDSAAELPQNTPSFVQPTKQVKTPRPSVKPVEHSIPAANHKTDIPKSKRLGNSINRKESFVCKSLTHIIKDCDYYEKKMAQTPVRNHAQRGNHQHYARMSHPNPQRHVVPTPVLTKSTLVPLTAARPVTTAVPQPYNDPSFVQPTKQVKTPRPSVQTAEHTIPADHPRKDIPKSKGHRNSKNRKACFVCKSLTYLIKDCNYHDKPLVQKPARNHAQIGNHSHYARMIVPNPQRHVVPTAVLTRSKLVPLTVARPVTTVVPHNNGNPQHALKDKGVIGSGCLRHMTGNMSYLTDFKEINGGYVDVGGNPKVLLRVPRENNMYNVDLKNIDPSGDLTCLFAKATLDESYL
nr:ribonuclease H-like domain-containing protein [Tanacetum cinerariifolium]